MGCNCGAKKQQYEVVDASGKRLFGPTPYKTTADAMATRHGATVRPVEVAK